MQQEIKIKVICALVKSRSFLSQMGQFKKSKEA